MKEKILKAIEENGMFTQGARLLAAVSGGADSVALLHFLCALREKWNLELNALHLNHSLRGGESRRDEEFVRVLCRNWKVPLTVEIADVAGLAQSRGQSLETAGREARYAFFAREASGRNAKVATAHTRSDSAETVLLNLARGTSIRGLAGIPPVRDMYIRPLIGCDRREVERYCAEYGLDFVTDSTNRSDDYARNRVRRRIIPLLEEENPRFLERQAETSRLLRADADYLDGLAAQAAQKLLLPGGGIEREGFLRLPEALRGRVLGGELRRRGVEASALLIREAFRMVLKGGGKRQLNSRTMLVCEPGFFRLDEVLEPQPWFSFDMPLENAQGGFVLEVFPGKRVKLKVLEQKNIKNTNFFQKKGLNYCLDCDRISKIVTLRQKLPGDKLRPCGRGCSKTFKNLFQEAGVPFHERLRRVVVAEGKRTLWLEGFGADESAAAGEKSTRVLTIEITEEAYAGGYIENFD